MTAPALSPSSAVPPTVGLRAFGDLDHELATTRRALERVPDAHLGWRPHPRSMSLGQLAAHLANVPGWGTLTLTTPGLDLATLPRDDAAERSGSRAAIVAHFDRGAAEFRGHLAVADDAALHAELAARLGDREVMRLTRVAMIRRMVISHMVHHRGQLSVYLRLLDVPVPSMYGPSADEGPA